MKAKKIASVLMLIGMFAVVALLSSCEKSDDEMKASVVPSKNVQTEISQMRSSSTSSASQYAVSDQYKNAYYNGYRYASNYFNDQFIKNNPIGVGFYAAYNASHARNDLLAQEKALYELCDLEGESEFRSYTDANQFQLEVENFLSRKRKPVVVSIQTQQKLNNGTYRNGTVIIWASNWGTATVTNTNFTPTYLFRNNSFYTMTYGQLLEKAKKMSQQSPPVANVAYMDRFWWSMTCGLDVVHYWNWGRIFYSPSFLS